MPLKYFQRRTPTKLFLYGEFYYLLSLLSPRRKFGVRRIQWAPKTQIYAARSASTAFSFDVCARGSFNYLAIRRAISCRHVTFAAT